MQWMWRSKFESRRHPLPHKDQWALDGAFKATLLPHWPPRAPHCRELIAATAPGNLPQKLTQGPHCAQDGKSERRLQNIGYRVDRPMDNPVLEETKYLQKMHDCMVLVSGFQIHQAERAIFFKCRPLCRIANSLNCWNCWIFFNVGCRTWQHHSWTGSWELWVQFSIPGSVAVSGLGGLEKWGKWAMRGVLIEPPARCCSAHSLLPSII